MASPLSSPGNTLQTLRRLLLALVVLGLCGTATELVLLAHYEDVWQTVPLSAIALALAAVVWHLVDRRGVSVRALQVTMAALIAIGALGLYLHYDSNLAFQLDMDATQSGWVLFRKVISAQAPPALAPAVMAQLGLLGLAYTYRHPALSGPAGPETISGD
jgi:hypothetical protein